MEPFAITSAIQTALSLAAKHGTNDNRSAEFVSQFASTLRNHYRSRTPEVLVLSRGCPDHKPDFRLNELLYDIHVFETDDIPEHGIKILRRSIWQIESEMKNLRKETIKDFNK